MKIEAIRKEGSLIHAHYEMNMLTRISETITSIAKVDLYRINKHGISLVFIKNGNPAGLDVNGGLEEIIDT